MPSGDKYDELKAADAAENAAYEAQIAALTVGRDVLQAELTAVTTDRDVLRAESNVGSPRMEDRRTSNWNSAIWSPPCLGPILCD